LGNFPRFYEFHKQIQRQHSEATKGSRPHAKEKTAPDKIGVPSKSLSGTFWAEMGLSVLACQDTHDVFDQNVLPIA
jgi:hypothetical protein